MEYVRDPKLIYQKSFDIVRAEADMASFPPVQHALITRLIHACGMVDIIDDIAISGNAVEIGCSALADGKDIICDVNMVAKGIIDPMLPAKNAVLCALRTKTATQFASEHTHTKSAGGFHALAEQMDGAIIAIGNAPTALFYLLEMLEAGLKQPALVLGFPVGFVGAAESKQALINNKFNLPYIALKGRRGGSAMAAAAVNALASGLRT